MMAVFAGRGNGRGAGGDQILLVNIGGNIVLNDGHLPTGWREGCISSVLCKHWWEGEVSAGLEAQNLTVTRAGRQCLSFTHAHLKGEASVKVAPFREAWQAFRQVGSHFFILRAPP